jgi:phage terminase large subunit-like protein
MSLVKGPTDLRNEAIEKLNRLPEEERLAVLDKLIDGRRKKSFIKYFEPWKPDQEIAIRAFTKNIKIFGLLGGNRSGKTIVGAFISVAWCLGKKYFEGEPAWEWIKDLPIPDGPVNVWIVGVDFGTLKDVLWHEKLRYGKSHPPFLPDDNSVIRKISDGDFQVFFQNGSILTGKSAEAGREKFQGASVDLIWIDEECDKDVFDECYQRTVDCAGKILLTQTPLTDINSGVRTPWVFDLYEEWLAGNKDLMFCQLSYINSPFIPEEEKQRSILRWAGDPEEGARLYGTFVRRSGLVYPLWDKSRHIVRPFDIPPNWIRIVSIDPAATGITAALWIAVSDKGDYFGYKEYYERERTVSEHAKSILMRCGGEVVDYWLLDPTWGGQRNAENHKNGAQLYREAGIPVRLPDVGKDFGMHLSREYINAVVTPGSRHPRFFIFQNSLPNFEHEITHYVWDSFAKGEQKGLSKEKPRKRNDHLINAFQYSCCLRLKARKSSNVETPSATNEYQEFFDAGDKMYRSDAQRNRSYT